jgi:hypothetical protein
MKRWSNAPAVVLVAAMILVLAQTAQASKGPKWSDEQLSAFSDAIVMGRVVDLASGWDPAVDTIYTYVTIEVSEVLKGNLTPGRLTIKQMGGVVGERGLSIIDQASFERGEEVLLFLEARPRDRSLYTVGLWQGKWNVEMRAGGERSAVRREPGSAAADFRSLDSLRASTSAIAAFGRGAAAINISPVDALAATPQEYVLMSTPYRYGFNPPVDVQTGGQSGLSGGGFSEIGTAVSRWNAAGSSFSFLAGGTAGTARCTSQILNNSRVTISFMDPCAEISDSGGTLALGGSYFFTTGGTTVNGQLFRQATEGFVVNNDSSTALQFLRQSGCFADIQLHELGHVLGLGHSADTNAIMFPTVNNGCSSAAHGLGVDDVQGLQFIYPSSTPPPTGVPAPVTGLTVTVTGNNVTVRWTGSSGATSYRLVASVGGATIFDANVGATTTVSATAPNGTYTVTVYAVNAAGTSTGVATSFTVGGGSTLPTAPATVTPVVGANRTITISWTAGANATSYRLLATLNGAVVFNQNIGGSTAVGPIQVPPGSYTVTVFSVNAAGESTTGTPTSFVVP